MTTIYIITGPAGVGKSTVSRKLAERLDKSALIEGDDIYHQVIGGYVSPWKKDNHLNLFWKVCLDTIKTYIENEYNVVFNYIINPKNIEAIKSCFSNYNIKFIILMANEETLLSRDKLRSEDCQMKERCLLHLKKFKQKQYKEENILNTTNLDINEIVDTIISDDKFIIS